MKQFFLLFLMPKKRSLLPLLRTGLKKTDDQPEPIQSGIGLIYFDLDPFKPILPSTRGSIRTDLL
jgi:hypothetical protein